MTGISMLVPPCIPRSIHGETGVANAAARDFFVFINYIHRHRVVVRPNALSLAIACNCYYPCDHLSESRRLAPIFRQKKSPPLEIARADSSRQESRNVTRPVCYAGPFGRLKLRWLALESRSAAQPDSPMSISSTVFPAAEDLLRQAADTYAPDLKATNLKHAQGGM